MFNKLRNRFLLMNMVIITFIMLLAFGTIYTITYRNIQNEIRLELHRQAEAGTKAGGGGHRPPGRELGEIPARELAEPAHERSLSLLVRTDGEWNILDVMTRFTTLDDEFYTIAVKQAAADPVEFGQFSLNGARWAYSVIAAPGGYSIIFMDVTAQRKILVNLTYTFFFVALIMLGVIYMASSYFARRSIAPVKEAFEKQKQFIADASHELKTPLTVINTHADVLLQNGGGDLLGEQAKWINRIKSETDRMKKLTNDLLYLTEMDDSRSLPLHVPFNWSEAVESVVLSMEAVIFEKGLSLIYDIEPGLMVTGSSEQLKQVVMILLDNAVKYNIPQGVVRLRLQKNQGCHVQLVVSNTGTGISQEYEDKIFDRFYRVDPSRSRQNGGYGLGLAIAKSIVEQHKGAIYAKSSPQETDFFVVLG